VTVIEVIKRSAEFMAKKGVDSPRLQVELLLAHLLKLRRMDLYLNFERVLTPAELESLRKLVQRRGLREPLQQIVGSTSFCGLEMTVTRNVLCPRPETEMLAEMGWEYLKAKAKGEDGAEKVRALDFGTGSGCLAIALAVKCPSAEITALDVSPEALAVAKDNAIRNSVESRMNFVLGDGFAALAGRGAFDLIVSNPPYIPSEEIATLDPEVRDFDPRLALDGGVDGLDFYRRLAHEAVAFLLPGGRIMLEFGAGQESAVEKLFAAQMWIVEAIKEDYSRRPRVLVAQKAADK
jgi:release factor glutamine methyltransferase